MRDYEVEIWAPDFDDVKEGTIIFVEEQSSNVYTSLEHAAMFETCRYEDFLRVVRLAGRPRVARVEHLRSTRQFYVRVDELLEWHDKEYVTIFPG